jgi:hypothetical protein
MAFFGQKIKPEFSVFIWIILPKKFDRTSFDQNTIWLKNHFTETPFRRKPFDRILILPKKVTWPKFFSERSFNQKPKIKVENWVIWPQGDLTESIFRQTVIWLKMFFRKRQCLNKQTYIYIYYQNYTQSEESLIISSLRRSQALFWTNLILSIYLFTKQKCI